MIIWSHDHSILVILQRILVHIQFWCTRTAFWWTRTAFWCTRTAFWCAWTAFWSTRTAFWWTRTSRESHLPFDAVCTPAPASRLPWRAGGFDRPQRLSCGWRECLHGSNTTRLARPVGWVGGLVPGTPGLAGKPVCQFLINLMRVLEVSSKAIGWIPPRGEHPRDKTFEKREGENPRTPQNTESTSFESVYNYRAVPPRLLNSYMVI